VSAQFLWHTLLYCHSRAGGNPETTQVVRKKVFIIGDRQVATGAPLEFILVKVGAGMTLGEKAISSCQK
jgi:hypothetical protein